jgi:SAM-dependent methyltransferase
MSSQSTAKRHPSTAKSHKKKPRKSSGKSSKKKKPRHGWRTAATSDKHDLYENSVQEPEADNDLIDQVWKELKGRLPSSIREDFCGTAACAVEWVKRRPDNTAIAIDLDPSVLEWGRKRLPRRLTVKQRSRLTLIQADVTTVETKQVDSVLAMNFSYYLFKTRPTLLAYFKRALKAIRPGGMMLLDAYGGSDSFLEMEEERDLDGFTYVWDQAHYNPINGDAINHIHYEFPDGTKMKRAFTYDWRLWTLPEIQELLLEAGFKKVNVYWEGVDEKTGEGDGDFKLSTRGDACEGWIAYIAAEK